MGQQVGFQKLNMRTRRHKTTKPERKSRTKSTVAAVYGAVKKLESSVIPLLAVMQGGESPYSDFFTAPMTAATGCCALFTQQARDVLFVFQANVIQQLRIKHDEVVELDSPWRRVRFRIVDGDFDFHLAVIYTPEPFGDFGGICHRAAVPVQPHSVLKAGCLHN